MYSSILLKYCCVCVCRRKEAKGGSLLRKYANELVHQAFKYGKGETEGRIIQEHLSSNIFCKRTKSLSLPFTFICILLVFSEVINSFPTFLDL